MRKYLNKILYLVQRYIFGSDIFISYSREDGSEYATALANTLSKKYVCKFDLWGTTPSEDIPPNLRRAIRGSGVFVLVGTKAAGKSRHVSQEIKVFLATKRPFVPIDIDQTMFDSDWWPMLEGTPVTNEKITDKPFLKPSNRTIRRITNTFTFRTRDQRLRLLSGITFVAFLVLLVGSIIAGWVSTDKIVEARQADERRIVAEAQEKMARRRADISRVVADSRLDLGEFPERAVIKAAEAVKMAVAAGKPDLPVAVRNMISSLQNVGGRGLWASSVNIGAVAVNKDATILATADYNIDDDNVMIRLWDLRPDTFGKLVRTIRGHSHFPKFLRFGGNERWLVVGGAGEACVWDLDPNVTPKCTAHWKLKRNMGGMGPVIAVLQDGSVGFVGIGKSIFVLDLEANDPDLLLKELIRHPAPITSISLSGNGNRIATSAVDGAVRIWDLDLNRTQPSLVIRSGPKTEWGVVKLSPDGRWVAFRLHKLGVNWTPVSQRSGYLWDLSQSNPKPIKLHTGSTLRFLDFSADGKFLATSGYDRSALWQLPQESGGQIQSRSLMVAGSRIDLPTFSPDGKWLVGQINEKRLAVWPFNSENGVGQPQLLRGLEAIATTIKVDTESRWLVAGSATGSVRVWSLPDLPDIRGPISKRVQLLDVDLGPVASVTTPMISADGKWIVTYTRQAKTRKILVSVWAPDSVSRKPQFRYELGGCGTLVEMDPTRRWLVLAVCNKEGKTSLQLRALTQDGLSGSGVILSRNVVDHAFSSDSEWIAVETNDGHISVTPLGPDIDTKHEFKLPQHNTKTKKMIFSLAGGFFATIRQISEAEKDEYSVKLYVLEDGTWAHSHDITVDGLSSFGPMIEFSHHDKWLKLNRENGEPVLYSLKSGKMIGFELGGGSFVGLDLSPNNDLIATTSKFQEVQTTTLWEISGSNEQLVKRSELRSPVPYSEVGFSPDGNWIYGYKKNDQYGYVFWDLRKAAITPSVLQIRARTGRDQRWKGVNFSPDGRWLVLSILNDPVLDVWDLSSEKLPTYSRALIGHTSGIKSIQFSQNGKWMATISSDATAQIWNIGQDLNDISSSQLTGHRFGVEWVRFVEGGSSVVTASTSDGTLRYWPLSGAKLLAAAKSVAGRNLTFTEWHQLHRVTPYDRTFPSLTGDCSALLTEVHEAKRYAKSHDTAEARRLFVRAANWVQGCSNAKLGNQICWWGTLYGFAEQVIAACDHAVSLAKGDPSVEGKYRDSRAVTRALLGRFEGAIEDFEFYIKTASEKYQDTLVKRRQWLSELRQNRNPIGEAELATLRLE